MQTDTKLKILQTDNSDGYTGRGFQEFLNANGIQHQKAAPHTPKRNGVAEIMNRTLVEKAEALYLMPTSCCLNLSAARRSITDYQQNKCVRSKTREALPNLWVNFSIIKELDFAMKCDDEKSGNNPNSFEEVS
ncbi:unnamed protein product [Hermetia illucens]|uniref:Integrase catalytic domain-containing protein n=1 Tax=Hermetia illucens TaxID=343691 RepID=A0A7R8Z2Z0_HERIL|nr:unnamed protein product [Hermetia illucens]